MRRGGAEARTINVPFVNRYPAQNGFLHLRPRNSREPVRERSAVSCITHLCLSGECTTFMIVMERPFRYHGNSKQSVACSGWAACLLFARIAMPISAFIPFPSLISRHICMTEVLRSGYVSLSTRTTANSFRLKTYYFSFWEESSF